MSKKPISYQPTPGLSYGAATNAPLTLRLELLDDLGEQIGVATKTAATTNPNWQEWRIPIKD